MKRLLLLLLALPVLAVAGAYVWIEGRAREPARPGSTAQVELMVPRGATARSLGPLLVEKGVIEDAIVWRYFLWKNRALSPKAGLHRVGPGMTLAQIGEALEGAPIPEDVP